MSSMRESLLRMEFFETYYYVNIIHNVLDDTMGYLRNLHSWHEDQEVAMFLPPFPKWSLLHNLAEYVIEELMWEELDDVAIDEIVNNAQAELRVDRALWHHGIQVPGFRKWLNEQGIHLSDVTETTAHEYQDSLRLTGELDDLIVQLTNEVFFVLFGNRALLSRLNRYVAGAVARIPTSDLPTEGSGLLLKDGVPARARIPEWARRAVFHRDRGMCATCNTDLTTLISVANTEHYDHVIPLAEGGVNDVTNLQLLCSDCNLRKGRKMLPTSNRYEAWYSGGK
jgi:HNH endonuclease